MVNNTFVELNNFETENLDGGKNIANVIGGTAGIVGIAWAPVVALTLGPVAGVGVGVAGIGALYNLISN